MRPSLDISPFYLFSLLTPPFSLSSSLHHDTSLPLISIALLIFNHTETYLIVRGTPQSTDIRVELTSTRRTALHRYTFPASSVFPRIVVDMTNEGQQSSTNPVMTIDPSTGRVVGASFSSLLVHMGTIFNGYAQSSVRRTGQRNLRARVLTQ